MSSLKLQGNAGGTGIVTLASPNTNSTLTFTLPSADGTNGQALTTNGSGTLAFATVGASAATPTALGTVYGSMSTGTVTAIGYQALNSNAGGTYNDAFGVNALLSNTTGFFNSAFGVDALRTNTTGARNVALGNSTLRTNSTGTDNTAVGSQSMYYNTTGANNSAFGVNALVNNTTGAYNTAIGSDALRANTTASNNTAVGIQALYSNTTAPNNTASGAYALFANTTGSENTAFGRSALTSNTTASNNTAVGYQALQLNTTGTVNTAVGLQALQNNTTGADVTAVGGYALGANTTGSYNTAVGRQALASNSTAQSNTAVGYQAGFLATGASNTFVGVQSGYFITTGTRNTILGGYTGNMGGLDIRTASNYIVLSDGDGNPRQIIDANGTLLINTTARDSAAISSACKLQVDGSSGDYAAYFRNTGATPYGIYVRYASYAPNNSGSSYIYCDDSSAQRFSVRSNGGVHNYQANDSNLSDRREKTNFAPAKNYLDTICAIPVQTFNYIDQSENDPGLTLGVVAQDVQAVAPELVSESNWAKEGEDPKMRLSIYQTDLQYALMKCIQELNAKVEALQAEITTLKGA